MSQKKVDAYKQNKKNRETESRKEVRRRRLEISIVLVIIAAGLIWFIAAGVSNSTGKSTTVALDTQAIDNFTNGLQVQNEDNDEMIEADDAETVEADSADAEAGE